MVDRSLNTTSYNIPFSPLRNTFIDDYESGMEASASSMASCGDEGHDDEYGDFDEEDQKRNEESRKTFYERQQPKLSLMNYTKSSNKMTGKYHRRMSSGNSSTDSNTTVAALTDFGAPLPINSQVTSRIAHNNVANRREDVPNPSSGYDGDTEGPANITPH